MTAENKDIGFIKIYRSIESWDWWEDLNTFRLFMVLLINANWKTKKWRGKKIKRGQLWTSIESLSEKSGLTPMQVRTSLEKLMKTNEITNKSTNEGRLITVVNYDFYQSNEGDITSDLTSNLTSNLTDEQQTYNKPITTTKEVKELNNNIVVVAPRTKTEFWSRLSSDDIDSIYETYPESGGDLIDAVAEEAVQKKRKIENPVPYILSYAKRVGWDDAAEHFDYWEGAKWQNGSRTMSRRGAEGEWLQGNPLVKPICSVCGEPCIGLHGFDYKASDFCPNCGADMRGVE